MRLGQNISTGSCHSEVPVTCLQLAFNTRFAKNWFWRQQSFGADLSEGVASWNHLPQDLLLRIAKHLGDEDRQVLGCCCAAWKHAIGDSSKQVSFVWAGRQERDNLDCHPMVRPSIVLDLSAAVIQDNQAHADELCIGCLSFEKGPTITHQNFPSSEERLIETSSARAAKFVWAI